MIALLLRDLRLALRAGGGFGLGLGFYLVLATLVPLAVGPQPDLLAPIAPGILWLGALLACLLSLDRLWALDAEDGSLDLLATSPLPLEGAATVKALGHWLTTGLPLTVIAAPLSLLLFLPTQALPWLVISLAVGTPALSWLGTFGAALTVGLKRGSLLLSLLVLPLYIPTLVFGAEVVRRGGEGLSVATPLAILGAISLGCLAILPFATGAALRANLR
ncbi:heme exporter protein B [Jannaschia pagri]|uniref:Heme exporter protein B n=1 Tax=Jannaschia pagri TaxID=2829797 RepID=A0ABQ4NH17_9RHOB|nr:MULTISPECIES: heme exporter protein CcmB [unclassified Jannaschia]GIT90508.1 heme exporter protein B [Jannaschia sp. AI_61]GIT93387.1 heme exporter protein B [Jannaschia sp. AI_62]